MRYVYTMEYYIAVRKNETMIFSGKWVDLEKKIMLIELIDPKDKYCMFHPICAY